MDLEKKLRKFIRESIDKNVFTCISVGISFIKNGNKNKCIVNCDKFYDKKESSCNNIFFDLASLTKPYVTVISILSLINKNKINLNHHLYDFFKEGINSDKKSITIEHLLSHTSGFPAYRDYFHNLVKEKKEQRKNLLLNLLLDEPLEAQPGCKVIYSDLGFMLLGLIIEKVSGIGLDEYFKKAIMEPIGLEEHLFYNPIGSKKYSYEQFAPVENCKWRGKLLQGEVSDENCWALGGVAGHAGLYGDIYGALALTELIMDIWLGKKDHPSIARSDLVYFLDKRSGIKGDTWALGFDRPNRIGASCGKYLSKDSVGHLGFTGTSFWIDPVRELVIVILSNRVHPSRDNELIKEFRPVIHDRIVEWLGL